MTGRRPRLGKVVVAGLLASLGIAAVAVAGAASPAVAIKPAVNPLRGIPLNATLSAITCRSATSCVAVGRMDHFEGAGLVLVGNPSSWGPSQAHLLVLPAGDEGASLIGVTCTSATSCVAVGYDGKFKPIVVHGNPTHLTASGTKVLAVASGGEMNSVACMSATSCVAVGQTAAGQPIQILGDPATWGSGQLSTLTLGAGFGSGGALLSVTCTSGTACVATGSDHDSEPFSIVGDPATWGAAQETQLTMNSPLTYGQLSSVTCSSSTACVADGYAYDGTTDSYQPITLAGDPSSWTGTEVGALALGAAFKSGGELTSIACTSSTTCVGAGYDYLGDPVLVQGNPGTWTVANATQVHLSKALGSGGELFAAACGSASACVAVGTDAATKALTIRGDLVVHGGVGASQTVLTSPRYGVASGRIHGFSCATATSCVAVGIDGNSEPIVVAGATTRWTADRATEVPIGAYGGLNAVACVRATWCVAVGGAGSDPLVLRGNPATWATAKPTKLVLPSSFGSYGSLNGVSCVTATACVAVGNDGTGRPITLHGNPATWSAHSVRQMAMSTAKFGSFGYFDAVTCMKATLCVAVGTDGKDQAITVHGNPATWTDAQARQLTLGKADEDSGRLTAVSCGSATACVAVGSTDSTRKTLILSGNPATWGPSQSFSIAVPAEAPSTVEGFSESGEADLVAFEDVDCTSATDCTALGDDGDGAPFFVSGHPAGWRHVHATRLSRSKGFESGSLDALVCTHASCEVVGSTPLGVLLAKL